MASITDREIAGAINKAKRAREDVILTDAQKARGVGRLRVRARPSGQVLFYFRYVDSRGKQDTLPLGVYDPTGKAGLTLRAARGEAGKLSLRYQGGARDLRAHLEHEDAEKRAFMETAARERDEAERQAKSGILKALLNGYVAHLERQGKVDSARDARNLFRFNIFEPGTFPHLAEMRASSLTHEDVSTILAKLIDRGAGRSAAKLRAYLRAAFAAALQASTDPTVHPDLHGFQLAGNPAASVPARPLARYNRARERVLNVSELTAFLKALDAFPAGLKRDALWLCLLLGGQRPTQLMRAKPEDVDLDERSITLFDRKGARKQPRPHRLPLTAPAHEIVVRYLERKGEDGRALPYLFTHNGKVPVRVETLSEVVTEIAVEMLEKKTARAPFQLRDIRRTCETMLAAMGISKDVRAQTQSHGLGGVQDRHYDRHEYMDEKRRALEAWDARLREIASGKHRTNVVQLTRK